MFFRKDPSHILPTSETGWAHFTAPDDPDPRSVLIRAIGPSKSGSPHHGLHAVDAGAQAPFGH